MEILGGAAGGAGARFTGAAPPAVARSRSGEPARAAWTRIAPGRRFRALARTDPRHFQIAVLGSLLIYGIGWLGFDVTAGRALAILGAALLTQLAAGALTGAPGFDPRSALISGLSLCLLL